MTQFLGLRTTIYEVHDLERAKTWFTSILGFGPYFDEPFYVGYSVGGYELGLLPVDAGQPVSVLAYWGVPDAKKAFTELQAAGASVRDELQDVGEGVLVGTVIDPNGHIFGIIENPYFKAEDAG